MDKPKHLNPSKFNLFFAGLLIFFLLLLSEILYTIRHRDILSSYILKTGQVLSKNGETVLAIRILTQDRIKNTTDNEFKTLVNNYLESIPPERDLPRALYDLALLTHKSNSNELTPVLLESAIAKDPDFSFWRVELSNYYLTINKKDSALSVIEDCIKFPLPQKHCEDFKEYNINMDIPKEIGFLQQSINEFYLSK